MVQDVRERVLKIICEVLDKQEKDIPFHGSLRRSLQLDSLGQMTLFIALEDEFQRSISPEQVADLDSVNDIVEFIEKKLQELPSP